MIDIEPDVDEQPADEIKADADWMRPIDWDPAVTAPAAPPEPDQTAEIPEVDLTRAQRYHDRKTRKQKRARRGQPK